MSLKPRLMRIDTLEKRRMFADDHIAFSIPRGVWDLSTLKMWFTANITGNPDNVYFTRDIENLIDTLEVYINNTKVHYIPNYNHIWTLMYNYNHKNTDNNSRSDLQNDRDITSGLNNAQFNVNNRQFCISKWLGILGSENVIDTRLIGKIEIKIKLANNNSVIVSNSTASTYSIDDVHLTLKQLDESMRMPGMICFDNYKSVHQYNTSFRQTTELNINYKNVDCIIATFKTDDFKNPPISATTYLGSGKALVSGFWNATEPNITWNFTANGTPLISYNPNVFQGPEFAKDALLSEETRHFALYNNESINRYLWACGCPLDSQDFDDYNITLSFDTFADLPNSAVATPNYSMVIVKTTSCIKYDNEGNFVVEI